MWEHGTEDEEFIVRHQAAYALGQIDPKAAKAHSNRIQAIREEPDSYDQIYPLAQVKKEAEDGAEDGRNLIWIIAGFLVIGLVVLALRWKTVSR